MSHLCYQIYSVLVIGIVFSLLNVIRGKETLETIYLGKTLTPSAMESPRVVKYSPINPLNSCITFCISGSFPIMDNAFKGSVPTCSRISLNLGSVSLLARAGLPSTFFKRSSVIQSRVDKNNYLF